MMMNFLAVTVDVESDAAAFADPKCTTFLGILEGLPAILDFLTKHGYAVTLFIACDILPRLDLDLVARPTIEVASHGYNHTYPPHYLTALSSRGLEREIVASKMLLHETFKTEVVGFRAQGLTINSVIMVKLSEHYAYDSSVLMYRKYDRKSLTIGRPYHPSNHSVVEAGSLPIIELPVSSTILGFFKVPLIGSYIRLLPESVLRNAHHPIIVLDLHSQDAVKFDRVKYLFGRDYLGKLEKIIGRYESEGYKVATLKEIIRQLDLSAREYLENDKDAKGSVHLC